MNTRIEDENNGDGVNIILTFSDFRIESEGDVDNPIHVFLRGAMIFDFINKYIKENKILSDNHFEIMGVERKEIVDSIEYEVSIYISSGWNCLNIDEHGNIEDDYSLKEVFYRVIGDVFEYPVTQRFNNTDITSTVYLPYCSGLSDDELIG